jgi:hypothetical protein
VRSGWLRTTSLSKTKSNGTVIKRFFSRTFYHAEHLDACGHLLDGQVCMEAYRFFT